MFGKNLANRTGRGAGGSDRDDAWVNATASPMHPLSRMWARSGNRLEPCTQPSGSTSS